MLKQQNVPIEKIEWHLFGGVDNVITNQNKSRYLLKKLEDDKVFNQIFEVVE